MKTINLQKCLRTFHVLCSIVILPVLLIWACNSVKPTESDKFQLKEKGAHSTVNQSSGRIDAWAGIYLGLFDPQSDNDSATFSTPSNATNVQYKVTTNKVTTSCDPLGNAETIARVDEVTYHYNSTGWISLSNGAHSFWIYASATHSTGISDCQACFPPPGECESRADTYVTVTWQ